MTVFEDARGPNVRELRQAQRRLSPAELKALIADYEAGGRVRAGEGLRAAAHNGRWARRSRWQDSTGDDRGADRGGDPSVPGRVGAAQPGSALGRGGSDDPSSACRASGDDRAGRAQEARRSGVANGVAYQPAVGPVWSAAITIAASASVRAWSMSAASSGRREKRSRVATTQQPT